MPKDRKEKEATDGELGPQNKLDAVTRRLDVIINLLAEWQPQEGATRSAREQTIRLYKAGLRPVEIASITGRHANNIHRDISMARKDGRIPKSVK